MATQKHICPRCGQRSEQVVYAASSGSKTIRCSGCESNYTITQPNPSVPSPSRRATIVQVAERSGVSVATVSNYLNDKGRMTDDTRQRIRAAVKELRFTPNSLVKAIRQHKTNILGIVTYGLHDLDVKSDSNPIPALLSGISDIADEYKYNLLLFTGWPHRITHSAGLDFLDGHIDGLMWISPKVLEPHMLTAIDAGLPTVGLLARQLPDGVGYVAADNVSAMRSLVNHLVSLGHKRIAYIGARDGSDFIERLEGYRLGLQDAGIEVDPELIAEPADIYEKEDKEWSQHAQILDSWLSRQNRPTAIMANKDQLAAWILEHVASRGLKVPDDISITGFDGSKLSESLGITSAHQDFHEIGRLGAETLIKLISGSSFEECRIQFACKTVVRLSTGPVQK